MPYGVRVGFLAAAASAALLLAGCGSGSGSRYSRPAFEACLHQHDVPTQALGQATTASDKAVAKLVLPIAPNFIAAAFPSKEYVAVAFAKDAAGAHRIRVAFDKLAKQATTPGKITQTGNLVLITDPHITAGTANTLSDCEKSAAVK